MKTIEATKENKEVFLFVLENVSTKQVSTIKELRTIDKLCKALENLNDKIDLEDSDFDFLKRRMETFDQWNPAKGSREMIFNAMEKLNV